MKRGIKTTISLFSVLFVFTMLIGCTQTIAGGNKYSETICSTEKNTSFSESISTEQSNDILFNEAETTEETTSVESEVTISVITEAEETSPNTNVVKKETTKNEVTTTYSMPISDTKAAEVTDTPTMPRTEEVTEATTTPSTAPCTETQTEKPMCKHENQTTRMLTKATCVTEGEIVVECVNCGEITQRINTPVIVHAYGIWMTETAASPQADGVKYRKCFTCGYKEKETVRFAPLPGNNLYIPSVYINANYKIADYTQTSVSDHDIVCNYDELGPDDPIICGHNTGSLKPLGGVKAGDYIYFSHDGITDTYVVTVSEFGYEVYNNTNIKGKDTETLALYKGTVPTLHIFTCFYHGMYGEHRWMVIAEKI